MIWFAIGAALGCLQGIIPLVRRPREAEHPISGLAIAAVVGALVYGTMLWLLTTLLY